MSLTKIQKRSLFLATLMTGVLMGWMPAFSQERGAVTPITDGSKVTIAFTITVPESRVTIPDNVSEYVSGQHQLIPALETALTGLTAGERKRVDLEPDQAFGPYDNAKMHTIQRDQLPPDA
ncbi:MAG: FKBP-type peptidyl-prolyl cis-trans isomerase, partial [Nitrospiraceae bacterium]